MRKSYRLIILIMASLAAGNVSAQTSTEQRLARVERGLQSHDRAWPAQREYNKWLKERLDKQDKLLQELNDRLWYCPQVQPSAPAAGSLAPSQATVPTPPAAIPAPAISSATAVPVLTHPPTPSPAALAAWEESQRKFFEERFGPLEERVKHLEQERDVWQQRLEQTVTKEELGKYVTRFDFENFKMEILEALKNRECQK